MVESIRRSPILRAPSDTLVGVPPDASANRIVPPVYPRVVTAVMRPDLLDAPLSVNWLPVTVSVASPEAWRQLITPVYVPDRSVCTPPSAPVGVAAAGRASAAAAPRGGPRRWRRRPRA